MRVLVTGGAGFIGSHVVDALRRAGHEVTALDNLHPAAHGPAADGPAGVGRGDVRDPRMVADALDGVEAVVHHAAMVGMGVDLDDLPDYVAHNSLGTAVLLTGMARAGVRRLVLASSMVVYGEGSYACARHGPVDPPPRQPAALAAGEFEPTCPTCRRRLAPRLVTEDAPLRPRSGYAATKVAQEHLADVWARELGASAIALRYHNVYGPGMPRDTPYAGVAAIFRSSLQSGRPPEVFEDGGQLRDFVHVGDVAEANVAAVAAVANGAPSGLTAYNIASGQPHTVGDLATGLADAVGGPLPRITGRFRAGDVRHIMADPAKARTQLGFKAATPFERGLREFAHAPLRQRPGVDA
jgi:dTDP-L-rhamnose 4-epimerase